MRDTTERIKAAIRVTSGRVRIAPAVADLGVTETNGVDPDLVRLFSDSLRAIALVLDYCEGIRHHHSWRVAVICEGLARTMGIGQPSRVVCAGLLHDIGSLGSPASPHKPCSNTDENLHMRAHATRGAQILRPLAVLRPLERAIATHHESWDGSGYPLGLSGDEIPLDAQIIHVADSLELQLREQAPDQRMHAALQFLRENRDRVASAHVCEAAAAWIANDSTMLDRIFDDIELAKAVRQFQLVLPGLSTISRSALLSQVLSVLSRTIDAKHTHTNGHSTRVAAIASKIAHRLDGLVNPWDVAWAGLLHDIGKVSISPALLDKTGSLRPHELEAVRGHARCSFEIISSIRDLDHLASAAAAHHENYDGSGYYRRLAGDQIPLIGRILAFADTFDALTSDRAHRGRMAPQEAIAMMRRWTGSKFDPGLADVAFEVLEEIRRAGMPVALREFAPSDDDDSFAPPSVIRARQVQEQPPKAHPLWVARNGRIISASRDSLEALGLTERAVEQALRFQDLLSSDCSLEADADFSQLLDGESITVAYLLATGARLEAIISRIGERILLHLRVGPTVRRAVQWLALFERNFVSDRESVIFTDERMRIIDVNGAFTSMFGFARDEVIGQSPGFLKSGEHDESAYREIFDCLHSPSIGTWAGELVDRKKDGSLIDVALTVSVVRDSRGAIVGYVGRASDISARKNAERELLDRDRELAQKNRELLQLANFKSEMMAIASHDLRSPIAAMLGIVDVLREHPLEPRVSENLEQISDLGRQLLRLVGGILDVERADSGALKLSMRRVRLAPLLRRCCDIAQKAVGKAVGIRFVCDGDDRAVVDPDRVEQIAFNLVINAAKFSPPGGMVTLRISDSGQGEGEARMQFDVTDEGPGIPPESLSTVFHRYFQVQKGGRTSGGAGLGLHIVRTLVDLHKGAVWAENLPMQGCRFVVQIPRNIVSLESPSPSVAVVAAGGRDADFFADAIERAGGRVVLIAGNEYQRRLEFELPDIVFFFEQEGSHHDHTRVAALLAPHEPMWIYVSASHNHCAPHRYCLTLPVVEFEVIDLVRRWQRRQSASHNWRSSAKMQVSPPQK